MADTFPITVMDLATAIAHAEGFGVPNAVPTKAHNPGDLKIPGWMGPKLGAEGITVFEDDETGWNALSHQLLRIKNNLSHVYNLSMTLEQFAEKWTDTQAVDWLDNVIFKLQELGYAVDKDMTLGVFFSL